MSEQAVDTRTSVPVCWLLLLLLLDVPVRRCGATVSAPDVVVVVLSQSAPPFAAQARQLCADLRQQARALHLEPPVVHLAHEDFPHPGAWTVLPLLPRLNALHGSNSSWLVLCEAHTAVDLARLLQLLARHDPRDELWLGHALYDREPTIIHHFAFEPPRFRYPHVASGLVLSRALLKSLAARLDREPCPGHTDFSIDASHELAVFVWDEGRGPALTHCPELCVTQHGHCATAPRPFQACGDPVSRRSIYFAVKTCGKFHKDRVPVVKKTWGRHAAHIGFYSEVKDDSIPTINLGVANTERGHCGKMMAILRQLSELYNTQQEVRWVVIADDDTILSVARLQQLLSCFSADDQVALGERYGYNVQCSATGYNYLTGGGGMVLSMSLVHRLINSGQCRCPSDSTPDDMFLGVCLARLGVAATHSPLFHQARPLDYAPEYLTQPPVSFHKHWMIDPINVYDKWFADFDQQMEARNEDVNHVEL